MVPASIYGAISSLITAVTTVTPLDQASRLEVAALKADAKSIVVLIDAAITTSAGSLDAGDPSGYPGDMVGDLVALQTASADQSSLCSMRGLVGRALFNLTQAG